MKILKRGIAIVSYLLLLSILLKFHFRLLWDVKQLLLVAAGAGILYFPFVWGERRNRKIWPIAYKTFGEDALWASFLETFILLFLALGRLQNLEEIWIQLAPNLRPLLYGFCIWQIMACGEEIKAPDGQKQEKTASESYAIWQELGLTRREREIAILVCQGKSNREIAESLYIAESTVKKHLSNIFEKLGIDRRDQLLRLQDAARQDVP